MSDLGFIEVNRASGIKAVFMDLPVFQIPVTDKNRILLGGDDLYNCGYWLKKQRNGYFICQNCGKEVANDKKPNGKGGRPPKYCKECELNIRNERKEDHHCKKCGKLIEYKSTTLRIRDLCASCQAEKIKQYDRERKQNSEISVNNPQNPNLDKPNENIG